MNKFDLLKQKKIIRSFNRMDNKEKNRALALKFDKEYFDGSREQGYGGYFYDGRWKKVAKTAVKKWGLTDGSKVLDIGCAKGFLLEDLKNINSKFQLFGIDISKYAIENSSDSIKKNLLIADCKSLPFKDNYFDVVFAINTIHNLNFKDCKNAIREIERVAPGRGFIQVDAYRTEQEREIFMDWMLTAKSFNTPSGWIKIFKECNYTGKYFWTIIENE